MHLPLTCTQIERQIPPESIQFNTSHYCFISFITPDSNRANKPDYSCHPVHFVLGLIMAHSAKSFVTRPYNCAVYQHTVLSILQKMQLLKQYELLKTIALCRDIRYQAFPFHSKAQTVYSLISSYSSIVCSHCSQY